MVKLTRSKAQALNKKVFNLTPLNGPKQTPEVAVLIREELKSDDEDEEYQPCDDDELHSDDDHNTTISDLDSQPRTPLTPSSHYVNDDKGTPKYTTDGLFKIPRDRLDSCSSSQSEHDYIIAKRTRSKVSLTTIPIETLESTFNPPDIPADMLDFETDIDPDNNWVEFLNVLTKPLSKCRLYVASEQYYKIFCFLLTDNTCDEPDDDGDPEYVAADKIPIDAEELRDVNISKKELNDLVEELMKSLDGVDFDDYESILEIPKPTTSNRQRKIRADSNRTPNSKITTQDLNDASTSVQALQEMTSFQPQNVSTPTTSKSMTDRLPLPTNVSVQSPVNPYATAQIQQNTSTHNSSQMSSSPLKISIPVAALNPYHGAVVRDGVIQLAQFQQIIVTVPTIDILNRQLPVAMHPNHMQQNCSIEPITKEPNVLPAFDANGQSTPESDAVPLATFIDLAQPTAVSANGTPGRASTLKPDRSQYTNTRYQHKLFRHLSHELPAKKIVAEVAANGFTENQRNIFDQQMRIHLQFATQTFMQTYNHPYLSVYATEFKVFLVRVVGEVQQQIGITNIFCFYVRLKCMKPSTVCRSQWLIEYIISAKRSS